MIRCPYCKRWFKNRKALAAHMRIHKRRRKKK